MNDRVEELLRACGVPYRKQRCELGAEFPAENPPIISRKYPAVLTKAKWLADLEERVNSQGFVLLGSDRSHIGDLSHSILENSSQRRLHDEVMRLLEKNNTFAKAIVSFLSRENKYDGDDPSVLGFRQFCYMKRERLLNIFKENSNISSKASDVSNTELHYIMVEAVHQSRTGLFDCLCRLFNIPRDEDEICKVFKGLIGADREMVKMQGLTK